MHQDIAFQYESLLDDLFTTHILLNSTVQINAWKARGETREEYVWNAGILQKVTKKHEKQKVLDPLTKKQKESKDALILPFQSHLLRFGDDEELSDEDPDADLTF